MKKIKNILSLFDGMSCGQIALNRLGIKYDKYFASEVDKNSMKVTEHNYPDTIFIGDIRNISYKNGILYTSNGDYKIDIDLMIGGSPCQNLSLTGKQEGLLSNDLETYLTLKKEGFEFKGQSYLFWEYLRLLNEIDPTYFLLENVKMSKKWREVITENIGVEEIEINSEKVSSQHRRRLYWTNIPNIEQPIDKNITIDDVAEVSEGIKVKFDDNGIFKHVAKNGKNIIIENNIEPPFTIYEARTEEGKRERRRLRKLLGRDTTPRGKEHKEYRINKKNKFNCLLATKSELDYIVDKEYNYRYLTITEMEKMQTVPVGYTKIVNERQARKMLGNGWTIDVIAHIFSFMK